MTGKLTDLNNLWNLKERGYKYINWHKYFCGSNKHAFHDKIWIYYIYRFPMFTVKQCNKIKGLRISLRYDTSCLSEIFE